MGQITTTTKTNSQMSSTSLILLISATVYVAIGIFPRLSSAVPGTMFCHKCSYTDLPEDKYPENITMPNINETCLSPPVPPDPDDEDKRCTEYQSMCVTFYKTFQLAFNGSLKTFELMYRECSGGDLLSRVQPDTCIQRQYDYSYSTPKPISETPPKPVLYRILNEIACYCQDTLYCNNEPGNMTKKSIRTVAIPENRTRRRR